MNNINKKIKKNLEFASRKDFAEIIGSITLTSRQLEIVLLMLRGYNAEDFPNNKNLYRYKHGDRLSKSQIAEALNISESVIAYELRKFYLKIEKSGFLDLNI